MGERQEVLLRVASGAACSSRPRTQPASLASPLPAGRRLAPPPPPPLRPCAPWRPPPGGLACRSAPGRWLRARRVGRCGCGPPPPPGPAACALLFGEERQTVCMRQSAAGRAARLAGRPRHISSTERRGAPACCCLPRYPAAPLGPRSASAWGPAAADQGGGTAKGGGLAQTRKPGACKHSSSGCVEPRPKPHGAPYLGLSVAGVGPPQDRHGGGRLQWMRQASGGAAGRAGGTSGGGEGAAGQSGSFPLPLNTSGKRPTSVTCDQEKGQGRRLDACAELWRGARPPPLPPADGRPLRAASHSPWRRRRPGASSWWRLPCRAAARA